MTKNTVYDIAVANEQSRLLIDAERLRGVVEQVLLGAEVSEATISIAIVDDATIHTLNRQYLQHDYPTDVLSFCLSEANSALEGEIVVSADTAVARAEEFAWQAEQELLLYVVHGALHLVGYQDDTDAARDQMQIAERQILRQCGIDLPEADDSPLRQSPRQDNSSSPTQEQQAT